MTNKKINRFISIFHICLLILFLCMFSNNDIRLKERVVSVFLIISLLAFFSRDN